MRSFTHGRKTAAALLLLAMLALSVFTSCGALAEENLLTNGDFEILDNNGLPEGWFTDAYKMDPGYSLYSTGEGRDGAGSVSVTIRNEAKNDARFAQTVAVEPYSLYRLSGYVRAQGVTDGHGANLSVEGVYAFSEKVYDTDGEWQYIEYYGETGPDQRSVTVFARLGGYSGESKGTASFDGLELTKVDMLPSGVFADLWYVDDEYYANDSADDWDNPEYSETETAGPAWPMLLVVGILYCAAAFFAVYWLRDGRKESLLPEARHSIREWLPVLALALLTRVVISYFVKGYDVDVGCFVSWGYTMAHAGPSGFYLQTSFCDYPPLYMYILGLNSWLAGLLGAGEGWTRVIFRFIPSLCDIAGCWVLLHLPKNDFTKGKYFRLIVLLFAFNPATIVNSAAWGQMDSVLCILLLCVAVYAAEGKWIHAIAIYATAVLVKPQALMLGILGLVFMVITALRDREARKKILIGTGVGLVLIAAWVIPFGIRQTPGWLITLYGNTLSSYPYATVNTANLYYITGGNWSSIESAAHFSAPLILGCACALHGILCFRRNRKEKAALAEPAIAGVFSAWFFGCAAFGASWKLVGIAAMAYAFAAVLPAALRRKDIRLLPYLGALLFILLYVFGIKMHERYLFPAFLLLMLAWAFHRDRRILYVMLLFSLTVFVNEGIVLDNSIRLGAALGHLNSDTVWLADVLSVLNILGAMYAVYLGMDLAAERRPDAMKALPGILPVRRAAAGRNPLDYNPDRKLHWTLRDTLILCGITAVYSVVALTTLGSTKAPQTAWKSSGEDEQIIFDLGEVREDVRVLYFAQVSREDFSWAASDDMEGWTAETWAQMDQGQCWKWKYVTQSYGNGASRTYYNETDYTARFSGRYLKLTSHQVGLVLNEVIFRDAQGNNISATVYERTGGNEDSVLWSDPSLLLDEQDTMENLPGMFGAAQEGETQPSWWNSTYFDEIYHARTGFEFLNGTVPYETSHPPLGKVLMSWCIGIFGMTPFGWRFAGAMAGILMLPGIYLLAKQLTKKTLAATFACLMMALDCMHLTQTQIATIDSFPVLFIIFAFFFMLRFMQTNLGTCRMREAVVPLALSGVSMGLAIASKWIGIYAGMGLAVLFFWHCFRSVRIAAKTGTQGVDVFRRVLLLCAWCLLFFIVIPAAVYLLSYIPYFAYNTRIKGFSDYLDAVWRAQVSMFDYHSTPGLGMDHPFYSPWWEWPIIGKPMFYATKQYIARDAALQHSIFSFGNPAVWWAALGALVFCLIRWAGEKHYRIDGTEQRWHLMSRTFDVRYEFIFIGLLAQYLPWVLVPRGTYIYHYFASVPFLILAMTACLIPKEGCSPRLRKAAIAAGCVWVAAAAVFFVILLPYATGMAAPTGWLDLGKGILKIWY